MFAQLAAQHAALYPTIDTARAARAFTLRENTAITTHITYAKSFRAAAFAARIEKIAAANNVTTEHFAQAKNRYGFIRFYGASADIAAVFTALKSVERSIREIGNTYAL